MSEVKKYRLFCDTESNLKYCWNASTPTTCPTNASHIIDGSSIAVVETISSNDVNLINVNRDDFSNIMFAPGLDDSQGLTPKKIMHKHSVVAGQTNIFDIQVTTERRINGGEYWICEGYASSVHQNDIVEFSIIDKDNVLGLFDYYSLVQGSDILELSKFVLNDYVKKGDPITGYHCQCFEGIKGTSKVYQGLYYRVMYDSEGSTDLNMLERYYYYE